VKNVVCPNIPAPLKGFAFNTSQSFRSDVGINASLWTGLEQKPVGVRRWATRTSPSLPATTASMRPSFQCVRAIVVVDNDQRSNVDVGRRLGPFSAGWQFVYVLQWPAAPAKLIALSQYMSDGNARRAIIRLKAARNALVDSSDTTSLCTSFDALQTKMAM